MLLTVPADPAVSSIQLVQSSPAKSNTVDFAVTFSEPVTGVDSTDFSVAATGGVAATSVQVTPVSQSVYTVTVSGITGYGTLGLNLVDDGTIQDLLGNHLANANVNASFESLQSLATGSGPLSVSIGDVNGDGKQDLAVANWGSNSVSVLLGNGNGTFQSQQSFATGSQPKAVATGDVNGDGNADLVVANSNSGTVSVLLGNGNGTFQSQQTFATGIHPGAVILSDVNGDGRPDLAVANLNSNTVSVLLGNGNGTFQSQRTLATGLLPTSVVAGDVNGDGKVDLVVANQNSNTVSLLLGNGNGTFQSQQTFATGISPKSVALADLDGDSILDLVIANNGSNTVSVLLGNGDGTFQTQTTFATGSSPISVVVGDLNGDGQPDLAVANNSSNTVSVLSGNGNGTFQSQQTFVTGSQPTSVVVGDLNRDARSDLVVANFASTGVSVLLSNGNGNFTGPVYVFENSAPTDISLSISAVRENQSVGTTVGRFTASDPDSSYMPQAMTYTLVTGTGSTDNGSFTIDASGNLKTAERFNYEAKNAYSIRIRCTDQGGLFFEKAFTISILNLNEAPLGTAGTVVTLEDKAYAFLTTDFGFTDPSDNPANALSAVKITTLPGAGTLTNNGVAVSVGQFVSASNIAGGKLVFTPAANANGVGYATFTFQVQDDGGTANGGVNIDPIAKTMKVNVTPVNDAPVGTASAITILEGTALTLTSANFGFSDPSDSPSNALSGVRITTRPLAGTLKNNGVAVTAGQVVTALDLSTGKLVYTPSVNGNGSAYGNFTFQVQDDGGTLNGGVNTDPAAKTLRINVTNVNDAPVGTASNVTILEDSSLILTAANFGFTDPNDTPANSLQAVKITTLPAAGSLTDNGIAVSAGQLIALADISSGKLVFTPSADSSGSGYAAFTFQVQDNGGTANGGVDLDPVAKTLTVNVTAVNDAPVGTPNTVTARKGIPFTFATTDFGFADPADAPANSFAAVKITTLPTAGTLKDNEVAVTAGQFVSVSDISSGKLVFTQAPNASGSPYTAFTFQVQDDGGTANGGTDLDSTARRMMIDVGFVTSQTGTTLTVLGTSADDIITVNEGASLVVVFNGVSFSFDPLTVTTLAIFGYGGNDSITVNSLNSGTTFWADGGNDDDTILVASTVTESATLLGSAGNDTLTGGSGNDQLNGGTGTNVLNGGYGDDTFNLTPRTILGTDEDTLIDPSGTEGVSFAAFTQDVTFNMQLAGGQTVDPLTGYQLDVTGGAFEKIYLGSGNDVVTGNATIGTVIDGGAGNDTLTGGSGNDQLTGGTGKNVLNGGDGNDNYTLVPRTVMGTDRDTLIDTSGMDGLSLATFSHDLTFNMQLAGAQVVDSLTGYQLDVSGGTLEKVYLGSGNDVMTGNATVGTAIDGGAGNDTLTGGNGNDRFAGGTGTNVLNGGNGDDTYFFAARSVVGTDQDTVIDSSGLDGLSFATFTHDLTLNMQTAGGQTVDPLTNYQVDITAGTFEKVYLGSGNDVATGYATLGTAIDGGAGNDFLTGAAGNDRLYGGTGTNVLNGGNGDDIYFLAARTTAGTDQDTVIDTSGTDGLSFATFTNDLTFNLQLAGAQTVDPLSGYEVDMTGGTFENVFLGSGNDVVTGYASVGTAIYGGAGNDTVTGGSGDDRLYGGTGTNALNGGAGDDIYFLASRTSVGTDQDTVTDSSGTDGLSFATFTHNLTLNLQVASAQTVDSLTGYRLDVTGGTFESIYLGSGNDVVTGYATLGTAIDGGVGNDLLTGGTGNDRLYGGTGTNVLNGGAGDDIYFLTSRSSAGTDKDTVIDSSGTDTLSLATFTHDLTFRMQAVGAQTVDLLTGYRLDVTGGTFENVYLGSGNDFVTAYATLGTAIDGGNGNNILIGGAGNDKLAGGTGNDILIGNAGLDSLTGNGGDDLLIGGICSYSGNLSALTAIRSEWTSSNSYQTRVDHLRGAVSGGANTIAGGASSDFFLSTTKVTDDATKDTLVGGSENDWFWSFGSDVTDKTSSELVN